MSATVDHSNLIPQAGERVLFITGRLAETVARSVVNRVAHDLGFQGEVHVVGISVAALMHVDWLNRKLTDEPLGFDRVIVPGWCQGNLSLLSERFNVPFYSGPKDILDLAQFFGAAQRKQPDLKAYDIEILAEINHAPRLNEEDILRISERYREHGADIIDLGCIPGETWSQLSTVVKTLTREGFRLSIDSFNREEVDNAIQSGVELILSCNSSNVDWLSQLGTEVVAIPDDPQNLDSLWQTVRQLEDQGCPFRVDPILEPIGFGFAASLQRYYAVRNHRDDVPIMMGVGNLTEMTEVDSSGVNTLLAAICQELSVQSILTTEVIPWCQTAVKEFDLARRLVKYAIDQRTPPKHLSSELVTLRDPRVVELGEPVLSEMAGDLKDANYRIFVERGTIHVMNRNGYWHGNDAFEIFDQFIEHDSKLDSTHAFYLGYELSKAVTALTLGKQYRQDQALQWGFLTVPELSSHERRRAAAQAQRDGRN